MGQLALYYGCSHKERDTREENTMSIYHVVFCGQIGYWEVWGDGRVLSTWHSRQEAEEEVRRLASPRAFFGL